MKSKNALIALTFAALFLVLSSTFGSSAAFAEDEEFNCDDPKCVQEKERLGIVTQLEGDLLVPGVKCVSGGCYNQAHPAVGTQTEVLITPPNTAPADTPAKKDEIKR